MKLSVYGFPVFLKPLSDFCQRFYRIGRNGTVRFGSYIQQEIAAVATGKPVELFQGLTMKDSGKLKNIVTNFIYGED